MLYRPLVQLPYNKTFYRTVLDWYRKKCVIRRFFRLETQNKLFFAVKWQLVWQRTTMHLIVDDITAERSGEIIFEKLHFTARQRQLIIINGPNGSGKSTLLRIIAGLLTPAAGRIYFKDEIGDQAFDERIPVSFHCHLLSHENAMKPSMTLMENLKFWARFGGENVDQVGYALSCVELDHLADTPFGYLSTGQKRRVAIARLLTNKRAIWLLDEPTSGLDQKSTDLFGTLMQSHLDDDGMIVAATHLPLGIAASQQIAMVDFKPSWGAL